MKDFTREDIAYYQAAARAAEALPEDTNVTIDASDLLRLLDMASRAVSVETVRAWWTYANGDLSLDAFEQSKRTLLGLVSRDLKPAAEAIARSAGEGKDG